MNAKKTAVSRVSPVRLGKGHRIEAGARIGVRSPRSKGTGRLEIGPGALIRSGTVVYLGSRIGSGLETGHHAVIREENIIGDNFRIWNNSTVDYGCRIGDNVKIHCNCYIAQFTTLEGGVFLAPGVTIANDLYPGEKGSAEMMRGPHLEKGVRVGVNATILPYVRIGSGSLIGAGAVVTRDVPAGSVAAGNPVKILGKVSGLKKGWNRKLALLKK